MHACQIKRHFSFNYTVLQVEHHLQLYFFSQFRSPLGLMLLQKENPTNLSFSVRKHLTWYRQRLCEHLGGTQERVTDSDLKEQEEALDPWGCLLPLYPLTPPFWFK